MAKKESGDINKRLINLLFINLLLILAGILLLDYLNLINLEEDLYPKLAKIPVLKHIVPERKDDPLLLLKEEEKKYEIARELEWQKLQEFREKLKEEERKIKEKEETLKEYEKQLKQREKDIEEKYKEKLEYKKMVQQQADYFVSMPPEKAVERLQKLDDYLIIDILKAIDAKAKAEGKSSLVPYYLQLMDPDRAAEIQRKMTVVE